MPGPVSVRWRLLVAFLGISAFAVLAAAASMWALLELGQVVERTTEERAPAALALLELSRQAERIAAAAPALLAAPNEAGRASVAADIRTQIAKLEAILAKLRGNSAAAVFGPIEASAAGLGSNLDALDRLVAERLATAQTKAKLLSRLSTTVVGTHRLVAPGILVLDSQIAVWRHAGADGSGESLARAVAGFVPLQKAQLEIAAVNNSLLKAADAPSPADLSLLAFPLKRSLSALEAIASEFEPSLRDRFLDRVRELGALAEGPEGLPAARERELNALGRGERMLAENAALSRGLTEAVDRLVAGAKADIAAAGTESRRVRELSTGVLGTIVLASLLSSALIVWLYVDRQLIGRLKALTGAMLQIAGGELGAPLPAPGGDEIGRMAEALRVFRDTALEVEEGRLRERQIVLDTIDYGVLILDPGLRVRMHNGAFVRLLGVDAVILRAQPHFRAVMDAARGAGIYEVPASDWEAYVDTRQTEIGSGRVQPREWQLADGRTLEYQCVPLPDGGRMITYFDLTHLKKAEAELRIAKERAELASRTKSDFLASMSHELRTPLNAIIGFTRLVMRRAGDTLPPKQHENLQKILTSAEHLLSLINAVLDLSKIEAGRMEVRPTEFPLEPLLDLCLATVEPMVKAGRVGLIKDIKGPLPPLVTDQEKLKQILINLLSNAAKFTEAGSITLRGRLRGEQIELAVADTGTGIPQAALELIFEEFRQLGDGVGRARGGTGLGLSISRRLARMLGGEISVASEEGRGSTFTTTIPVRLAASAQELPPIPPAGLPAAIEASPELADELVLAIDDDPNVVYLLKENLADTGYRVIGAASGEEGLQKARELRPRAITLDVIMPGLDGWQVLHALKTDPLTRDIPVILVSIVDQKDLGFQLAAADYVVKPFDREALIGALARVAPRCRRILVVDDDPNVAELVRQWLEGEGCTINWAPDGVAGLERIAQARPGVIFLDLLMPRMDGFAFLDALQADAVHRDIPVIVLTAKSLTDADRRLLQERVLSLIDKRGLDREAVIREVRRALPSRPRQVARTDERWRTAMRNQDCRDAARSGHDLQRPRGSRR
jgi:adenylate cyclase